MTCVLDDACCMQQCPLAGVSRGRLCHQPMLDSEAGGVKDSISSSSAANAVRTSLSLTNTKTSSSKSLFFNFDNRPMPSFHCTPCCVAGALAAAAATDSASFCCQFRQACAKFPGVLPVPFSNLVSLGWHVPCHVLAWSIRMLTANELMHWLCWQPSTSGRQRAPS
jgi:hypothetical protein